MSQFGSNHFNAIGPWLQKKFGERVIKLSLDGGFTCPNRDGTKGFGGCSFCSDNGSGSFAGTIDQQIALYRHKWPKAKYIAYFQNHTNTYGPTEKLRSLWDESLRHDGVVGLAIATRPDCLPPEVLELLEEYNQKTFLWVELGLQTAKEETAAAFGRGYTNAEFEDACARLKARGIPFVVHLILGLPGESVQDMLASARFAAAVHPFGLKLHMLHLLRGTRMAEEEMKKAGGQLPRLLTKEEYVTLICDILEELPCDITIHRLTGDGPKDEVLAPLWTTDKHAVLNAIQHEFKVRGTEQGTKAAAHASS